MKIKDYFEEVEVPADVKVSMNGTILSIKGKNGELSRDFFNPVVSVNVENNKVSFSVKLMRKNEKMIIGTFRSHINNMIKGVQEPYVYKLKICSGHFPMNVSISNNVFTVKNFIGEKVPRVLKIQPGVDVKIEGDLITVTHISKEVAGQTAASIEELCKRPGFDKRVFQQGIYITEKAGKRV